MPQPDRPLLFVAPNSYVMRNWVASGLADLCATELGVSPAFVSPFRQNVVHSPSGRDYPHYHIPFGGPPGRELPVGMPRLAYALFFLRLRTFALDLPTGGGQLMRMAEQRGAVDTAVRIVRLLAPRGSWRHAVTRRGLLALRFRHELSEQLLRGVKPVAVIVGSPGVQFLDHVVMLAAQRLGIPVHCVVNSWDNLTSRGPMQRWPDSLAVWNRHMADLATGLHDYPADRVHMVGSLQFTRYGVPVSATDHKLTRDRLGLPDNAPYVLYLTGAQTPQYEAEDVAALLVELERTPYRSHRFVVRLHPQLPPDAFASLNHPRVHLDRPPRFADTGDSGQGFDADEMRVMAALLAGANLVVASCGTTALLEAAIFDRPMLQLRWMRSLPHSRPEEVAIVEQYQRFEHIKPLDASGCRVFSDAPADVATKLALLQSEAASFQQRRMQAVKDLATVPLGEAPARVVAIWRRLLGTV